MSLDGEATGPERANMVLLGHPEQLRRLYERADLPAHFLALFSGGLYDTAGARGDAAAAGASSESPTGSGDLEQLWKRYDVVGLDVSLLRAPEGAGREQQRERRYRDNLAQELASRRVVLLGVLREIDVGAGEAKLTFVHEQWEVGRSVVCRPGQQTLGEFVKTLEEAGLRVDVERSGDPELARLRVADPRGAVLHAECSGACDLADLFDFQRDEDELVSRWFDGSLAGREQPMIPLLQDCAERQEHEMLEQVVSSWLETKGRMQAHTQRFSCFELVVIATRAFRPQDRALLDRFAQHGRVWVMTDQLRAGGDMRTLVHSVYVWPDAVASLLSRLALADHRDKGKGYYGWRSFTFGAKSDGAQIEQLRRDQTAQLLEEADGEPKPPRIERVGPFESIPPECHIARKAPEEGTFDWDEGGFRGAAQAAVSEQKWRADHRLAGEGLGERRMRLGRTWSDPESEDPERRFSQRYWQEIHRRPGVLRRFADGRHLRGGTDLLGRLREHRRQWQELLQQRRVLAEEREALLQHAEELDRAHQFYLGALPRLLIGAVVASFVGFICLNVIRILVLISPATWSTGTLMFFLALFGGFVGALGPAWIERRRGQARALALQMKLKDVDAKQRKAVEDTRELFRDAEEVRQTLRVDAIRTRTVLLADRAWSIVRAARDDVAGQLQQRKDVGRAAHSGAAGDLLEIQDRSEWRSAAFVCPEASISIKPEGEAWLEAFNGIKRKFLEEWGRDLEQEDRLQTGFLRASVLRQLVTRLSDYVVSVVERELLREISRRVEDQEVKLDAWVEPFGRAVGEGQQLSGGALLSVRYEGNNGEDPGDYRWQYSSDAKFAGELLGVLKEKLNSKIGKVSIKAEPVERSLPLGGFAVLFHELRVHWHKKAGALALRPGRAPERGIDVDDGEAEA